MARASILFTFFSKQSRRYLSPSIDDRDFVVDMNEVLSENEDEKRNSIWCELFSRRISRQSKLYLPQIVEYIFSTQKSMHKENIYQNKRKKNEHQHLNKSSKLLQSTSANTKVYNILSYSTQHMICFQSQYVSGIKEGDRHIFTSRFAFPYVAIH